MKTHRLARVSEVIREVAASTILFEMKDPRVKNVTVTRAEVSADLQHAKVYVSVMGSEREQKLTMHGLQAASGFVQTKLAKRMTTRYIPHITFVLDDGIKKSIEIARIIREENEKLTPVAEATPTDDNESEDLADSTDPTDEGDPAPR